MIKKIKKPKFMSFAVTWSCNSKCYMCSTWKQKYNQEELSLDNIRKTFSNDIFSKLEEVILTGGEPTLRSDIKQIIEILHNNTHASIGITSNGLKDTYLIKIVEDLASIPISLYLSLDGPSPQVHDRIRGVKGSFKKIGFLVNYLKEKPNVNLSLGMIITPLNMDYILKTKELCNELGVGFGVRLYEITQFFHNLDKKLVFSREQKRKITKQLIKFNDPLVDEYYCTIIKFLKGYNKKPFECLGGQESFFLSPNGDVNLCAYHLDKVFGNVKYDSLESIFMEKQDKKYLAKNCSGCLNACEFSWSKGLNAL